MPLSLSIAFRHSRGWRVLENGYRNGESQRRAVPTTSLKAFELGKRLTSSELEDLRAFRELHILAPFFFYFGLETVPLWSWDATGATVTGRYTVGFDNSQWVESLNIPRHDVSLRLIERS